MGGIGYIFQSAKVSYEQGFPGTSRKILSGWWRVCKYYIFPCSVPRSSVPFERIWGWTSKTTESKGAFQPPPLTT
jgi:hypothetical protein